MNLGVRKVCIILIYCVLLSGALGLHAGSTVFSNTNFITINDTLVPPTKASPYPSSLTVSGLPGQVVTKVTITLYGFTHHFPSDVTILLVGPQGQQAILISASGGQMPLGVTNITLTLDDDSTNALPFYTTLYSGTFMPGNGYLTLGHTNLPYNLPSPAPPGSADAPARLLVFNNTDPAGVWNLFVVDDASDSPPPILGSISGGWSLQLTTGYPLLINRAGPNVTLSWSTNAHNCQLQSTGNPSDTSSWRDIITPPSIISGMYVVTNPVLYPIDFYHLIQP